MKRMIEVTNEVSTKLEAISAQVQALTMIAKPAEVGIGGAMTDQVFDNYVMGIVNAIDALALDLDDLNNIETSDPDFSLLDGIGEIRAKQEAAREAFKVIQDMIYCVPLAVYGAHDKNKKEVLEALEAVKNYLDD